MIRSNMILCAEDDDNYAFLLKCALQQSGCLHKFHRVADGDEAVAYLKGEGKYADRAEYPIPYVILADLKMPRLGGFELLRWVRRDSSWPYLPVIVLTSSEEYRDVQKAYSMGANSFLVKPFHQEDLQEMVKLIDGYWLKFNISETPPVSPLKAAP